MTEQFTPRGFKNFLDMRDTKNQRIRVRESSVDDADGGACVWIFCDDGVTPPAVTNYPSPCLNVDQAQRLAWALAAFVARERHPEDLGPEELEPSPHVGEPVSWSEKDHNRERAIQGAQDDLPADGTMRTVIDTSDVPALSRGGSMLFIRRERLVDGRWDYVASGVAEAAFTTDGVSPAVDRQASASAVFHSDGPPFLRYMNLAVVHAK